MWARPVRAVDAILGGRRRQLTSEVGLGEDVTPSGIRFREVPDPRRYFSWLGSSAFRQAVLRGTKRKSCIRAVFKRARSRSLYSAGDEFCRRTIRDIRRERARPEDALGVYRPLRKQSLPRPNYCGCSAGGSEGSGVDGSGSEPGWSGAGFVASAFLRGSCNRFSAFSLTASARPTGAEPIS